MKLTALAYAAVVAVFCLASPAATEAADEQEGQNIVVHLSHFTDDLHRSFMAVKLAGLMQKKGAKVHLFLDIEGVRLADKRQSLEMTWGPSKTPLSEHYEAFVKAGGKVVLCPHCAHAGGIDERNLAPGASILNEEQMAKMLLDAEKLLDY
ncbi:DsrE family protein [Rubinisphaera brasiliensis]|uniref:Signal peptide-domain containing protein n=1 Tax=Rubinisphaera brasiliensis (strain ATCC 49424 / DSM 5305 / JCM 21570 / IAM 15109 / NBRC 103401 / IFAM 1448) TaxID=756272 RepID=F0SLN2_RUBBR|nr:DsrE family protein [Rubinisphaera brasiliensis]ADY58773.1 signal peptide-domain containing protein [Rubinisphaera brasiliensis DSM 5305]